MIIFHRILYKSFCAPLPRILPQNVNRNLFRLSSTSKSIQFIRNDIDFGDGTFEKILENKLGEVSRVPFHDRPVDA